MNGSRISRNVCPSGHNIPDGSSHRFSIFSCKNNDVLGSISVQLMTTGGSLNVEVECSNNGGGSYVIPTGFNPVVHSAGDGFYELLVPVCGSANLVLTASGGDVVVTSGTMCVL